jgi:hypothetical protein
LSHQLPEAGATGVSTPDNHLNIFEIYFYFMCMDGLPACTSIICVLGVHGGQKGAWDLLELELEMVDNNVGPLEEQLLLLTAETSLQPLSSPSLSFRQVLTLAQAGLKFRILLLQLPKR